jgi:Fe2+ transport system protein FeoA
MVYEVVGVPQNNSCDKCNPCLRVKLMEMGFISGQDIEIQKKQWGLYVVNLLSKDGHVEQTIAMREDELGRICLKEKP